MTNYYLIALLAVFFTAISQALMKYGVRMPGSIAWRIYFNRYTLTAYAILVMVTLMNLFAFKEIQLKEAVTLLPLTLLLVLFLSRVLLHERLTRRQMCGAMVTVAGILIFNI